MERYEPGHLAGDSVSAILQVLNNEFQRLAAVLSTASTIDFLHAEPTKLREGLTVGADGTDWDPGAGKGVYTYYDSAWHKLG